MRSFAHFKTHPIHPMLVPFPIAFFTGTLIFDGIFLFTGNAIFFQTATHLNLAGIIATVITAIPGFIDYLTIVPPQSSGQKRAARHGIINVNVLILFVLIYIFRNDLSLTWIVILDFIGIIFLTISGWMGGTMVFRNQFGVDHRYAHAGKWKVTKIDSEEEIVEVAKSDELQVNQMKLVKLREKWIVIGKTESEYVAFDDHCTHKGGSLADGAMICGTVQCPWHGSQFDVITGEVKAGPAEKKINTYKLKEENGIILLIR
jgi:uncharacterized membrane protein/nitrite reductase/ring-hydroxylating ferredoxin subunit